MRLIGRLVALYLALPLAFAQIDPQAQVVLDRYEQRVEEALAAEGEPYGTNAPIDTLETVRMMRSDRNGEFRSLVTTVVDRPNERLASSQRSGVIDDASGDASFSRLVYDDGTLQGVMFDEEMKPRPLGEATPVYETLQTTVAELLEASLAFMADPGANAGELGFARYDGPVSYGGVLEGEQLTLDALPFALSNFMFLGVSRVSVVYAPDGAVVGHLVEADGETTLTVYERPRVLPERSINFATYALSEGSEGEVTLLIEVSLDMAFNEPLDEGWFKLPETVPEKTP